MDKVAGVILAGGKSSRMGRDKALLPFRGARLIDHIAATLHSAGIADIFVSGNYAGFECINDTCSGAGPVGGICSAVDALYCRFEKIIFVPVDLPKLEPNAIQVLLQAFCESGAHFDDEPLPILIKLSSKIRDRCGSAQAKLKGGKKIAVWQIIADFECISLPPTPEISKQIAGINTADEWEKLNSNE